MTFPKEIVYILIAFIFLSTVIFIYLRYKNKDSGIELFSDYLRKTSIIIASVGLIISIIVMLFGTNKIYQITNQPTPTPTNISIPFSLATQIVMIDQDVSSLKEEFTNLSQNLSNSNNSDLVSINTQIESLQTRLAAIEKIILEDPVKALDMTLIKRDVDNLTETYDSGLASIQETTKSEIERLYKQNQWFIGLMMTMTIGLLGIVFSNFIKKPTETK